MKYTVLNRVLSGVLAVTMISAMILSASAASQEEYKTAAGEKHTIQWTEGVFGLSMSEDKEDFVPGKLYFGGVDTEIMEAPHKGAQGWFDLTVEPTEEEEKETPQVYDSGYRAAAANLTYWWLLQNQEPMEAYLENKEKPGKGLADPQNLYELLTAPAGQSTSESKIYSLYEAAFPKEAKPDQLLDFFLNGYTGNKDKANEPKSFKPNSKGGYFYPVFEKNILTNREEATAGKLLKALDQQHGAILRLERDQQPHYVNLWGVEEDENGKLSALYISDSLDEKGMLRFPVSEDQLILGGYEITEIYSVSLGTDMWTKYMGNLPQTPENKPTPPAEKPEAKPEVKPEVPAVQWENPTYEWSKDNKTCVATRKEKDGKKVETEKSKVTMEQSKAPSHKQPGVMTYTAEFEADWAEKQVRTEEIPAKEVSWNKPTYRWDDVKRLCYAERTSREDPSIQETAVAVVTAEETKAPTCTEKGQTTHTAVFEEEWAGTQTKTLDNIEKLEPKWGITQYRWSEDHKTCTAVRVCKNEPDGSHVQKSEGKVTKSVSRKPTSSKAGVTTYTAEFDVSWAQEQKETAEDVPALNVSWGEPVYTWDPEFRFCRAVRTDRNDPNHQQKAEAPVFSRVTKKPTCTKKGETTYTAEFKEDWAKTQSRTVENIPAAEPDWGKVQYQWNEDFTQCKAVRTCKNEEGHAETAKAKVTSYVSREPTDTEKGETTYTATFQEDWAVQQVVSYLDIPPLRGNWGKTQYDWTEDHSKCIATRVSKSDPDRVESAFGKVTAVKTKGPTTTQKGETTYTAVFDVDWATTQRKTVANIPMLPGNQPADKEEAKWNPPAYEWNEDHSRCTAKRTQKGSGKTEEAFGTVTKRETEKATCTKPGEIQYTAEFKELWAKKQTVKVPTERLEHKLQKVEAVEATAGKPGIQAHYQCRECKKLFLDEKATREVTREQLMQEGPSVAAGYAILSGVPEKDDLVAIAAEKFKKAYDENPGAEGVSISVGSASVTYSWKDVEKILKAVGDNKKLQLEICRTDSGDSSLTPEQMKAAEANDQGILYYAQLSYVKNGKNIPIENLEDMTITLPYTGSDAVRIFKIEEDGSFQGMTGTKNSGYVTIQGGSGVYLLSENGIAPGEKEGGSKVGLIIWISVLTVSGLLCLGLLGFYLYQKKLEQEENAAAHRFAAAPSREARKEPKPTPEQDVFTPEEPDFDMDALDETLEELLKEEPSVDDILKENPPKAPVSPAAPKPPMQAKPTIAEKTAKNVNRKHSKV